MSLVGRMSQIGMHRLAGEDRNRFPVGAGRAVRSGPRIGDLGAGEHAGRAGSWADPAAPSRPAPLRTASESQDPPSASQPSRSADVDPEIHGAASRRAVHDTISPRCRGRRSALAQFPSAPLSSCCLQRCLLLWLGVSSGGSNRMSGRQPAPDARQPGLPFAWQAGRTVIVGQFYKSRR